MAVVDLGVAVPRGDGVDDLSIGESVSVPTEMTGQIAGAVVARAPTMNENSAVPVTGVRETFPGAHIPALARVDRLQMSLNSPAGHRICVQIGTGLEKRRACWSAQRTRMPARSAVLPRAHRNAPLR